MFDRNPVANSVRPDQRPPLAVVGISALYPGSFNAGAYWRTVLEGHDQIRDVPPHYWLIDDFYDPDPMAPDRTYGRRGAFLDKVAFDPMEYGIPPANLSSTDTCQLLALMVAKRVLMDAGQGTFPRVDKDRISVILGVAAGLELVGEMAGRLQRPVWVKALREQGLPEEEVQQICDRISAHSVPWKESTFPGLLGNVVTGRIANRFDLRGTNCTTDAACASSFSAMSMAANELYMGDSDLVITGGVDTTNDPFLFMCFSKTPALSFSNDCRPFSDKADGTMLGEGLGMVALRRLEDAERDGDQIYAVVRGIGTSSDGRAKSVYAPRPEGQAKALRRAYQRAGYGPDTVELLEAHGTGTMAGDFAEFHGAKPVFEDSGRVDRNWCALGSVKSQLGHTKAAAGVAGLIKVVFALRHKVLPPTIKIDRPDPNLDLAQSPFYLNSEARPWVRDSAYPRRGAVSSFGFGGTNFHVTVEEYRGPGKLSPRKRAMPAELVLLSAGSPEQLVARCKQTADELVDEPGMLEYLARTSQEAFDAAQQARLSVVAGDLDELGKRLGEAVKAIEQKPNKAFFRPTGVSYGLGPVEGKVAFLFSGQGSQYLGMGRDLALHFDEAVAVWDAAAELPMEGQLTLPQVVFPRPVFSDEERDAQEERLRATQWAQPAIGGASLAIADLLEAVGVTPDMVGGHSFGEVSALCAASVLSREGLLKVARRRGELMAEAAAIPGSMTAVVHDPDELSELLDGWGRDDVVIANINSPMQTVISGTTDGIEQIEQKLDAEGIQFQRLPVATAFHSPVVAHAAGPFADYLADIPFSPASIPVYANSEAAPYPDVADAMRGILSGQIARPVRWVEQMRAMWDAGARVFVEVGPGSILTGLAKKCLRGKGHVAMSTDRKGKHGVTALWQALGSLAAVGLPLDFAPLWAPYAPMDDPRSRKKPKISMEIDGVNYGKIYPPEGGVDALPKPNPPREPAETKAAPEVDRAPTPTTDEATSPSAPTATAPANPDMSAWVAAYADMQRQTSETHRLFQQSMAHSHQQYMELVQQSAGSLVSLLGDQPLPAPTPLPTSPSTMTPPPVETPALSTMMPPPTATVMAPPPTATVMAPPPTATVVTPPPVAQPTPTAPATAPTAPENGEHRDDDQPPSGVPDVTDLRALLLSVVAEKTGYPEEILAMEMELEADLGIDSIKRVEILSALQERLPHLPEVEAEVIPNINTLGQVLELIEEYQKKGDAPGNGGGNGAGTPIDPLAIDPTVSETLAEPSRRSRGA